jgi:hypothetical protein
MKMDRSIDRIHQKSKIQLLNQRAREQAILTEEVS